LVLFRQGENVETVGGDVVGGGAEGDDPKERNREQDKIRAGQGEREPGEGEAEDALHAPDPEAARFENIHDRTPERFQHPRQIEEASVETNKFIGDAEGLIEDDGDGGDDGVGQAFGEVERGDPGPRVSRGGGFSAGFGHELV